VLIKLLATLTLVPAPLFIYTLLFYFWFLIPAFPEKMVTGYRTIIYRPTPDITHGSAGAFSYH
jgi:hypothetical protein